jgi:UPF0755 protein
MWLPALLRQLELGGNNGVKIVIPEGFSARQIAERLEAGGVCKAEPFLRLVEGRRLEGYLFPTTYFLAPQMSEEDAIRLMRSEFERRVLPLYRSMAKEGGLTLHQTMTLASIVEREAEKPTERGMIAAVYLNRMRLRMRLEADPTIQYALGHWKKGLTGVDLKFASPYNTYLHYGLPPGPICSPGLDSVRAALSPATTDALYFVADNAGGHRFSATIEEHIKNKHSFKRAVREARRRQQSGK